MVYILSTGRSGSTLLDLLLNTHPDVVSFGEIQLVPFLVEGVDPVCGCGERLDACQFWKDLLSEPAVVDEDRTLRLFRESRGAGRVLRPRLLPGLLLGRPLPILGPSRRVLERYVERNLRLFSLLRERSTRVGLTQGRNPWMVDSSKDPYRLLLLARHEAFDVRVIHLVKDPRAYVFSTTRPDEKHPHRRVVRMAGRWLVQNSMFSRVLRAAVDSQKMLFLRYEDLATNASEELGRIARFLEIDAELFDLEGFRRHVNHAIAGNPMRWRSDAIRLDDRWVTGLAPSLRRLTWALTGSLARRFGYPAGSDRQGNSEH